MLSPGSQSESVEDDAALLERLQKRLGGPADVVARVPGRVNLIGGHLDYHEGVVLPLAIDRGLAIYARRRPDTVVRVYSEAVPLEVEFDLRAAERHPAALAQYCQGAVAALSRGYSCASGCDAFITGDLPMGRGLSSSSALVVGFIGILARLSGHTLTPMDIAELGNDAEHWFGTTGGIMDQYTITHGRQGHAILIDFRSLTHAYVPMPESAVVVVADTGSAHYQLDSPFSQRRREAEAGLQVLKSLYPGITALRDVTPDLLADHQSALMRVDPSGTFLRRCRHVVTEIARVETAVTALRGGDVDRFGALMSASHASLRDNYDVSCKELDVFVDIAVGTEGVFGARMTGAGFGGSAICLVAEDKIDDLVERLRIEYPKYAGRSLTIYLPSSNDGASVRFLKQSADFVQLRELIQ